MKNQLLLHHIYNTAADSILIIDPKSRRVIDANQTALCMLGYTKEELLAKAAPEISTLFTNEVLLNAYSNSSKEEKGTFYAMYRRKDNSTFEVSGYMRYLQTGHESYIVISATETSNLKKAEESNRFKANLLNAVGQAVIATDPHGNITYWNRMAEQMYGWSEAEAMGQNIIEITPTKQSKEQAAKIVDSLKQGCEWKGTFEVKRKDGTSFPALVTSSPLL